jgi:hypothetical protein
VRKEERQGQAHLPGQRVTDGHRQIVDGRQGRGLRGRRPHALLPRLRRELSAALLPGQGVEDGRTHPDQGSGGEKEQAKKTGISDSHADGFAKFAQDNSVTIIVRTTNPKSLPYQNEDPKGYRPKPLALSALNTAGTGKYAGLIVQPDWRKLMMAEDPSKKSDEVDYEIALLQQDCARAKPEEVAREHCGWYLDNHGVLRDAKKRAVYGDYDLQGIYDKRTLLDTNDSKDGKRLRKRLNEALDPNRTDEQQWLVQHGANDNYRKPKDKTKMGRQPTLDEDFMVYEPDGDRIYVPNLAELKKYYEAQGLKWLYEKP